MQNSQKNSFIPIDLLCEYQKNPTGIDRINPRFSWKANAIGQNQSSYQILVAGSIDILNSDIGDIWNSGKVTNHQSINIIYKGKNLESQTEYFWKVTIYDNNDNESEYSNIASFEMGILNKCEWQGDWLKSPSPNKTISPMFRKEFSIDKKIKKVRAYICGLGYYELRINGKKVGDHLLDPGWTDYNKRVFYETYDVNDYLNTGQNAIGIMLGTGWYQSPYTPKMIIQLNIEYDDNTYKSVISDNNSWRVCINGPIIKNTIYNGEVYDARLEKPLWDTPNYKINDNADWLKPTIAEPPSGMLIAQHLEPIKIVSDIKPINMTNPKPNIYVYDLGQNIAGWVKLNVQGKAGTKVIMKFAETIYDNGLINQENLRIDKVEDIYILNGNEKETYEPRFTYHGFRYIQLEGYPQEPTINSIIGRVVHSSVKQIGHFTCSNPLINQIQKNILWTERDNLHSIPTDCPQRNERLGWLNDATVRSEAAVYNYNMSRFYDKWENDISDTQGETTGAITDVAPYTKYGNRPADPVSTTYLLLPWLLYTHYNDTAIIKKHYEGLKRWEDYLGNNADNYIVSYSYWGDWASPVSGTLQNSVGSGAVSAITPGILMSTGYYYYNAILLSKMANLLDKKDEEKHYIELSEKIKQAFNDKFFNKETCQYASGSQGSNTFPLYLGLVSEEHIKQVAKNIADDVITHDYHLTTGNLCTKYIMEVLTKYGYGDIAYRLITQTTYPSWGYMIENGATTIWERWEYETGGAMNSHNHPMYGAVSAWFYKYLAGINVDENNPGFGNITIKPYPVDGIDFVECTLNTVKGDVVSNWRKADGKLIIDITVPWNSTADVWIQATKSDIIKDDELIIWENIQSINTCNGMVSCNKKGDYVIITVSSGNYKFTRENSQ